MLKGKDFKVLAGTGNNLLVVAAAKECRLDMDCEMIEIANYNISTARVYIPGRTGWKVSVNGLVPSSVSGKKSPHDLKGILMGRNECNVKFRLDGSSYKYEGDAFITSLEITGNVGNIATYSAVFQGTGELSDSAS